MALFSVARSGAAVLLSGRLSELRRAALNPTNGMAYHQSGSFFNIACTGNSANGFLDAFERYLARVSRSGRPHTNSRRR
jgi:hypothetical protein